MTPEFRDAVYKWNFEEYAQRDWERKVAAKGGAAEATDAKKDDADASKSERERFEDFKKKLEKALIPRQLQKLFAMLQLSEERAIATKVPSLIPLC